MLRHSRLNSWHTFGIQRCLHELKWPEYRREPIAESDHPIRYV
jgi:hypothetical protein